jgi:hydroxymethylbilane synthase
VNEALDPALVIPAPGQGALAIECRAGDEATRAALAPLSDPETEIAVACERGVMHAVGGSCTVPFGAYAVRDGQTLRLSGILAREAGTPPQRIERTFPWPKNPAEAGEIGRQAGKALLEH